MKTSQILKLLKTKLSNNKGDGTNLVFIIILLLLLGVSTYFNLQKVGTDISYNFDQQVDSILSQKYDSIRNEVTYEYQGRIVQYAELVNSKSDELESLRKDLDRKNIQLKKLRSRKEYTITVKDKDVIPVSRVNNIVDSVSKNLTAYLLDSLATDSIQQVENLLKDQDFVSGLVKKLALKVFPNQIVSIVDTTTNLKWYGSLDLSNDSLTREFNYSLNLIENTFYDKNRFSFKQSEVGINIAANDPNVDIDLKSFYVKPRKINFSVGVGVTGSLVLVEGNPKFLPAISFGIYKPLFFIYKK